MNCSVFEILISEFADIGVKVNCCSFVFSVINRKRKPKTVYKLCKGYSTLVYNFALKVLCHFAGVITPDFSTYQDFPEPIKIYNTYRMRAFGYWLGVNGISVINNVRWGTSETYRYCFDGVQQNSIIAIGTCGGSPRKHIDRKRFEAGLAEFVNRLQPHTIVVYGSANYDCFDRLREQGIKIVAFSSETAKAFERRKCDE
ncbi:MAG: DUF4417 domain-containing protein [Clostridia bacterium]|nr:DUF4417 domain-containing protein [Clostridia bacterium]